MASRTETPSARAWRLAAQRALPAVSRDDLDFLLLARLGWSRTQLLTEADTPLPLAVLDRLDNDLAALGREVPLAYLLGTQPFRDLDLAVTSHTLVPRADTEVLVEQILERLPQNGRLADLGTGTGAVALAVARARPDADVLATDVSEHALRVARDNARRLGLPGVRFAHGDWSAPLAGEFDVIASNPPYVESTDPALAGALAHEPRLALDGGPDGLDAIRALVPGATSHLKHGGWLLLEHGHMQASGVSGILAAAALEDISTALDLAGRPRVTLARRPSSIPEPER